MRNQGRFFILTLLICTGTVFAQVQSGAVANSPGLWVLQDEFPGVRSYSEGTRVRSVYGRVMTTGQTVLDSAERFRATHAGVFGAEAADLVLGAWSADDLPTQPIMFDPDTGRYKFTLVYYSQRPGGIPVFRSELRMLVRNEPGFPIVLAKSTLHDLTGFDFAGNRAAPRVDLAKAAAKALVPELRDFGEPETVIWAGTDGLADDPVLAVAFGAGYGRPDAGDYGEWLFVADAATGGILYQEDRIVFEDVVGNVRGMATPGPKAAQCTDEVLTPMPSAHVNIQGGGSAYTDANGDFVISNAGTTDVTVESPVGGLYFWVYDVTGNDEELPITVTPPGPADFIHNQANNNEFIRAQVNAYVDANEVRDWILSVHPTYPIIHSQTGFTVRVNRNDLYCPGNAWYSPGEQSLNFCRASLPTYANTAFASVGQHEYGHHTIECGGSGQGEYGEGMADCVAMLIADDPGLGYGFYYSQCATPLRSADNDCQYLTSGCSTCGSEIHDCGKLLSGCVWSTREELVITEPALYLNILSNLTINSILLHTGTSITPQIAIDFLTLDDNDGDIDNGTPHWNEICAGFGAHGLDCPALALIDFTYPYGLPGLVPPGYPATISVHVVPVAGTPVPGTGTVSYRIGDEAFTTVPMNEINPNQYEAVLPPTACAETVEYYFTAEASGGLLMTDPSDSPSSAFAALAATNINTVAAFDFESATGWTVSGDATDGQWQTGVPANGGRGDPPSDYDGSGSCYLTDNVAGNSDVDGGTTILTSPTFDVSGLTEPQVSYARWYSNVEGASPEADTFVIRISDDNGANWSVLETVGPTGPEVYGGWYTRTFNIADFVTPTAELKLRFEASDLGSGSVVEAALDAFEVFDIQCGVEPPAPAPAPHDTRKNRYISFAPNTSSIAAALRVELVASSYFPDSVGVLGWVGEPDANNVSRIVADPVYRIWTELLVYAGDCEIVPVATYHLRAIADGDPVEDPGSYSAALAVETIGKPGANYWADGVGQVQMVCSGDRVTPCADASDCRMGDTCGVYLGPDGFINFEDIGAAVKAFQKVPGTFWPDVTWVDLHGNDFGDAVVDPPNYVVNFSDVQQMVLAFQANPYPFSDPADCP